MAKRVYIMLLVTVSVSSLRYSLLSFCLLVLRLSHLEGQFTILRFCLTEDFGEYLISKGADDSIVNFDGLTCYEGLSMEEVDAI